MSKIIAISDEMVSIGMDSGKLKEVSKSDCNLSQKLVTK
jgi:hypothetical protein